jgi:hypothetical protein
MSYDQIQAGIQMTLSAIAYAGEKEKDLAQIKADITEHLANPHYATEGMWSLVWGPVVTKSGDNLAYIVQKEDSFTLVLRGTVGDLKSYWEDIPTCQVDFEYVDGAGKVSSHFVEAQEALLEASDESGKTLSHFILDVADSPGARFYVTGHSQGGGLVPMFSAWITHSSHEWNRESAISCTGYAFAPPTAGDHGFAEWIGKNVVCYMVENPLDIVPFAYGNFNKVIDNHIPTRVPLEYRPLIEIALIASDSSGAWEKSNTVISLSRVQLPHSVSYLEQIGAQHGHNSYLYLLGVPQTSLGAPSLLESYDIEKH